MLLFYYLHDIKIKNKIPTMQESHRPFFIVTFDFSKEEFEEKLSEFDLNQIEITSINDIHFITKFRKMQPEQIFIDGRIPATLRVQELIQDCVTYSNQDKFELMVQSFNEKINLTGITHVGDFNELKNVLENRIKVHENT